MDTALDVVVVGAGRLGRAVAAGLRAAGLAVELVHHDQPWPPATCTWLAVPDGQIAACAARVPRGWVLHSAGSLGPEVAGERGAVLHPLMTFPPPPGTRIPCTMAGAPGAVAHAAGLAARLGWEPVGAVSDRVRYHAAACLAAGHLAAAFEDAAALFASATGLPISEARRTLEPLAQASLARVVDQGPSAITGPAARGDTATIAAHRQSLPPELLPGYDAGTARIEKLRAAPTEALGAVKSRGYIPIGAAAPEADDA